jgi:O-acetyl-ADP-ribose deacetylase (regulator of RNase III)
MAIHVVQGNLLESDCTVIAHQCNCFSTMGAGIAKQIKAKYPEAYEADRFFGQSPEDRLGKYSIVAYAEPPLIICNLYGQFRYGRDKQHTDYDALNSAMEYMFQMLSVNQHSVFSHFPIKLGMPYGMGAGLAGGQWDIIYHLIQSLSVKYDIDVYLYKL